MELHWGWRMFASRNELDHLQENVILTVTASYSGGKNLEIKYWYKLFVPLILQSIEDIQPHSFEKRTICRIHLILSCDHGQNALQSCAKILFLQSDSESSNVLGEPLYKKWVLWITTRMITKF